VISQTLNIGVSLAWWLCVINPARMPVGLSKT